MSTFIAFVQPGYAKGQAAHAEQHFAQAAFARLGFQRSAVVIGHACAPVAGHFFQVADQQVSDGFEVSAAAVVMTTGCACAFKVVAGWTIAGARAGAVQVLAPEQNSMA